MNFGRIPRPSEQEIQARAEAHAKRVRAYRGIFTRGGCFILLLVVVAIAAWVAIICTGVV